MNRNLGPQFESVPLHELDTYESADFEVPMKDVPGELEHRFEVHQGGTGYVSHTGQPSTLDGYVNDLAAHMREHGSPEPLEVYEDNVVTDGHHRYAAAKRAGLTHLPVERKQGRWFG